MASVKPRTPPTGPTVYDVRWREAGRARSKTFKRRVDATRFRSTLEADMARGDWNDETAGRETIDHYAQQWLAAYSGRPCTIRKKRGAYDGRIGPALGHYPVTNLTHAHCAAWAADLTAAGLAAGTVRNHVQTLRQICAHAIRVGAIRSNPADGITVTATQSRPKRFLTAVQVEALADGMTDPDDALLVRFLAFTGLRIGEAFGLQVGDLDFDRGRFTVARTCSGGGRTLQPTKTGKVRSGTIAPHLSDGLAALCAGKAPTSPVWVDARVGGVRSPRNFGQGAFKTAAKRSGLEGVTPHDMRHTCAALLVLLGAHPKAMQEWLGHSSITMTLDTYGHLFDSISETLATGLGEMLRNQTIGG